ncbi:MAG: Holliday junction branch migration protein RuvA [Saprospiraceae bacterium]|jgi:Holliday junction DNA helicase RuvA
MIAYIKGEITVKHPSYVVVEAAGVGYHISITASTYARLEKMESAKVLTWLHVKEDSHTLYGFADEAERLMFTHLISVSGVGPSTAQQILSSAPTDSLRDAIIAENEHMLKGVKGIGAKTAKRIILDLKDRLLKEGGQSIAPTAVQTGNTLYQEALMGLESLGIPRPKAQRALGQAAKENPDTASPGDLIKAALKLLSA